MSKVTFIPKTKEIKLNVPPPKPAKLYVPDWYKQVPKFEDNKFGVNVLSDGTVLANATIKSCLPFMDGMTAGYIQETWCDIFIENTDGQVRYVYSDKPQIISNREKVSVAGLIDDSFYPIEFVFHQPWIPKLPKGYSMLYTHPINRLDLPFQSLSGIIDNDKYFIETLGNHPFFVKKGFSGIIPAGTPIIQMIPVKREDWTSDISDEDSESSGVRSGINRHFYDGYKKMFWSKKSFN
jgi:hypothetical protein